jgi:hypothetical protein
MGNIENYKQRFYNLMESTMGDVKPLISEQNLGIKYSVQNVNGKFRIFVTTPKYTTPTDAATVFGEGTMWKDYNTEDEAKKAIASVENKKIRYENSPIP